MWRLVLLLCVLLPVLCIGFFWGVQRVSSVCHNISLRLVFGVPVVFVVECDYVGCDDAMAILFW